MDKHIEISEGSHVKLSLVVALVGSILGAGFILGGGIWWAAVVQTKLDTVIQGQQQISVANTIQDTRIATLELKVQSIQNLNK